VSEYRAASSPNDARLVFPPARALHQTVNSPNAQPLHPHHLRYTRWQMPPHPAGCGGKPRHIQVQPPEQLRADSLPAQVPALCFSNFARTKLIDRPLPPNPPFFTAGAFKAAGDQAPECGCQGAPESIQRFTSAISCRLQMLVRIRRRRRVIVVYPW